MKTSDILFCFDATFDFLRNLIWLLYGERCMGKIFKRFAVFYFIVFHCLYVFMPKDLAYRLIESVPKAYSKYIQSAEIVMKEAESIVLKNKAKITHWWKR